MKHDEIINAIKSNEIKIESLRLKAKELFLDINNRLLQSNGVLTSEIENNYKQIDSTFNVKSKLEGEVKNLKLKFFEIYFN